MVKSVDERIVVSTTDWKELCEKLGSTQITYVTSSRRGSIYANTYDANKLGEIITH